MKKNKQNSSFEKELLKQYRKPGIALGNVKYFGETYIEKSRIISRIKNKYIPGYSFLFKGMIAKDFSKVNTTKYIPYHDESSLVNHLEWITIILEFYQQEINDYISMKNSYIQHQMKGDYQKSLDILNNIDQITYSLWGMEQTLLCTELMSGLEDKTKKLAEFFENTESYLVALFGDFYNIKTELSTSFTSFEHKINSYINALPQNFQGRIYKNFIEFKLFNNLGKFTEDNLKQALSLSATLPVIDLYENFIKSCIIVISSNNFETYLRDTVVTLVKKLNISDYRISKILAETEEKTEIYIQNMDENIFFEEIIEDYTLGDYVGCINKIEKYEGNFGLNFPLMKIVAKSVILSNSDFNELSFKNHIVVDSIIKPLIEIFSCNETQKNLLNLLTISKAFGDIPLRYEIEHFYLEYMFQFQEDLYNFSIKVADLYTHIFSPIRFFIEDDIQSKVKKTIYKKLGYINTLSLIEDNSHSSIPNLRLKYYQSKNKQNNDRITSFKGLIENLIQNGDYNNSFFYNYEKLALQLFKELMMEDRYLEAMGLLVDSCMINKNLIIRMDKKTLFNKLQDIELIDLKFVIFVYLVDENNSFGIYSALISYIESKGKNLLSEIVVLDLEDEERELLKFILSEIYTKSVMKHFIYLNPEARSKERVFALDYLINSGYKKSPIYIKEIKEINKIQSIQKRIKSIDETKIYVDIESILKEFRLIYLERFLKYMLLEGLDANLKFYDLKQEIHAISSQFNEEVISEFKSNPERKYRYLIFKDIVDDFRNEVLFNSKYGLGKFLSSRIRHGLLENTITKTFKNYKLLSLKQNNEAKEYIIHKDREKDLVTHTNFENRDDINKIRKLLNDFSHNIVTKLDEIKDWLRIKDRKHPTGMFSYDLLEGDALLYLYSEFKDITDYDSFYRVLTDYFWEITENNLSIIQKKLMNEVFEFFVENLELLGRKLEEIRGENDELDILISILHKDINLSKVGIKTDLNEISNWFVVRRTNEFHDFSFQELIDTNLEIIKKSNKDCEKINFIEKIDVNLILKGEYFNYLVDIFNMLYSNANEHCGHNSLEELTISTEISHIEQQYIEEKLNADSLEASLYDKNFKELFFTDRGEYLKVSIKNSLSSEKNNEEIRMIIDEKLEAALDTKRSNSLISEEGGTGLTKIYYILKHNLKVSSYQEYYINDDNYFNVDIYLNILNIKAEKGEATLENIIY
ncbi:hypothetical protein RCG23_10775 [Neobacillus sp. PS3-34]|uniref:hypothetical protein n=1 Tax=Neobacillus sp. PS3-34 TaxID=3070678 RepID=UPI0027E1B4E6|nr:hypothetical protein [Neobacillus sp. PS3-34]WML50240.1 hypothetical protein RCG23_10775 [Neobacillus sp. PS3-34]